VRESREANQDKAALFRDEQIKLLFDQKDKGRITLNDFRHTHGRFRGTSALHCPPESGRNHLRDGLVQGISLRLAPYYCASQQKPIFADLSAYFWAHALTVHSH
jgi:hypothetical protein